MTKLIEAIIQICIQGSAVGGEMSDSNSDISKTSDSLT